MTRDEAQVEIYKLSYLDDGGRLISYEEMSDLISFIYDGIESRVCNNCKFYDDCGVEDALKNKKLGGKYFFDASPKWGCNEWEQK